MPMKLSESNYSCYVYRSLICLAILLYSSYTLPIGTLHYGVPLLYNICSMLSHISIPLPVMEKKRYALAVSPIHLETTCFIVLHTVLFGRNASLSLFLIVIASPVYFRPCRSSYILYLPFTPHMLTFFLLHEQMQGTMFPSLPAASPQLLLLRNSFGSFPTIPYIAYVSNTSVDIGKEVLKKQNESLLQIASYGSLIGLRNRTYLKKVAPQLCLENCCLIIGGIDDFKRISDTCGHSCGDAILKQLAEHTRTRLDPAILVCHWGGEKFVFLPHSIREQNTLQQLQGFYHRTNHIGLQYGEQNIPVTMTSGICCHQRLSLDELVNKADQLLYQGKQRGKHTVVSR